jgi:iron complex outermembrane receptor protein
MQAPTATAQTAAKNEAGQLQEVVVTARRVTERLQDVPLSVAALPAKELAKRQIQSINDLGSQIPNLSITPSIIPGAAATIIRGISSNVLPDVSLDNAVGHYIDGVYVARQSGATMELADLARLEVYRGPQGTLFGRNVTAGAINFITADPSGNFHMEADGTVGNYERYRAHVMIDLPAWHGFSLRAAFAHDQTETDTKNPLSGVTTCWQAPFGCFTSQKSWSSRDDNAYFVALKYDGFKDVTLTYKFDMSTNKDGVPDQQMVGITPAAGPGVGWANDILTKFFMPNGQPLFNLLSPQKIQTLPDPLAVPTEITSYGHNFTAEWRARPDITFKNIFAYRHVDSRGLGTESGGPIVAPPIAAPASWLMGFGGPQITNQHQITEEFQTIIHEKKFDFTGGFYYFEEHGGIQFFVIDGAFYNPATGYPLPLDAKPIFTNQVNTLLTRDYPISTQQEAVNKSYAIYGHTVLHITDQFDLSGGVRYTRDDRSNTANQYNIGGCLFPQFAAFIGPCITPNISGTFKGGNISYDVTATYKIMPDVNVYARYATGYLSGGFRGTVAFKPESTKEAELGLKSEWLDHRLLVNVDAYHDETTNYQVTIFDIQHGVEVVNVGAYMANGVEFESKFIPIEPLHLEWDFGFNQIDYTDHRRNSAPRFNTDLVGEYNFPKFSDGAYAQLRLDAQYQSRYWYGLPCYATQTTCGVSGAAGYQGINLPDNFLQALGYQNASHGGNSTTGTLQYLQFLENADKQGDNWILNLRVSLLDIPVPEGKARASFWIKNLTDYQGLMNDANYSIYVVGIFHPARTFGMDLAWEF